MSNPRAIGIKARPIPKRGKKRWKLKRERGNRGQGKRR